MSISYSELNTIIKQVLKSVPHYLKDECETQLLLKGLSLMGEDFPFVYTSLKNKKIDVIRVSKKNKNIDNCLEYKDNIQYVYEYDIYNYLNEKINFLYIAYFHVNRPHKKLIRKILWLFIKTGKINIREAIKQCNISERRGYKILSTIRKKIRELEEKEIPNVVPELRSIQGLYDLIRTHHSN